MSWALKRQIIIIAVLVILIGGLGFVVVTPYINELPTCSDGKQNQDETGVDCGGSCISACLYQVDEISVLWTRAFQVVPGRYNAVAYLENHNKLSAIRSIKYRFRFADRDNIYIGKREGETVVPASGKFAVFEPAINFGASVPVYATFEFTETPRWVQVPEERLRDIKLLVSDIQLEDENTSPRLSALVKNSSLFIVPDIDVVTVLYDKDGNAVSASRTYLEELNRGQSAEVNFTWPEPLSGEVIAQEIIPIYDIFLAKLK